MNCLSALGDTLADYGLRSIGIGARLLPKSDITLCDQIVLIGSGMLWNVYFGAVAISLGFVLAIIIALGRASARPWISVPCQTFIFVMRGSPLFLQFFFAYQFFSLMPLSGFNLNLGLFTISLEKGWFLKAWLGALIVLILSTAAYSAHIFYGALQSIPQGDLEAADACGLSGWSRFRRIVWPTMLRLAWPSYTNEAIFLFHATALVFFSSFPAWRQEGDALYYASHFADKTFNPFTPYPIAAAYFILFTLFIIGLFGVVNRRLNRHLAPERRLKIKYAPTYIR
jgi:polar amino acid transport system permease protein